MKMSKVPGYKDPLKTVLQAKTAKRRAKAHTAAKMASAPKSVALNDLLQSFPTAERKIVELKIPKVRMKQADEKLMTHLRHSLTQDGLIHEILVWKGEILDGNARVDALRSLGWGTVMVKDLSHLSYAKAKRIAVSVNRLAQIAPWDTDGLRDTILDIDVESLSLDGLGFDPDELDIIRLDPLSDVLGALDETPESENGEPVCREGDLWLLGDHRLLCGNALDEANYQILLGTEQANAVFTDPPYNVAIANNVSGLGKVKHKDFVEGCGEKSDTEYEHWLTNLFIFVMAHLSKGASIFTCIDWRNVGLMLKAGQASGLHLINMVVWNKMSGSMGTFYRSAHELIPVFCNGSKLATNNIKLGAKGRDRTNVWDYPGANRPGSSAAKMLKDHPTPKPVEMVVDALLDVTHKGDIVLDPFIGSGTTIVAAEECGRIARGIELDPKYVDVSLRRWHDLTGYMPILSETGETFEEVVARRLPVV